MFPIRTFFPSGRCDVPWGRTSALAGVAPEALEEGVHSCKVFCVELSVLEAFALADLSVISAGLGNAMHAYWHLLTIGHIQKVWPFDEPLSLGPLRAIGASSLTCLCAPSPPLRRAEG
jgi:hypothetical protein